MTTLRNFVSAAIEQFLGGVMDAQKSEDVGQFVAPPMKTGGQRGDFDGVAMKAISNGTWEAYTTMRFDVAVTADSTTSSSKEGAAKAGLSVLSFGMGAEGKAGAEGSQRFENVSRVRFAVHIKLPPPPGEGGA